VGYLLTNAGKAGGFSEMGYTAKTLRSELQTIGRTVSPSDLSAITKYGPRFEKAVELVGPGNVTGRIKTVWQIDSGTDVLRLITGWAEVFK
jgi:hypothetical protein